MTETYTIKEAWGKACEHDNIPVDSSFVVFSEGNVWAAKHNRAMGILLSELREGGMKC